MLITETVTREITKATARLTQGATTNTLRINSGISAFRVMDPFDWTQDRELFSSWQMWSEKAKHAFKTMEGDPEEMKISVFHHWINSKGIDQINNWKHNRILILQAELDMLTPEQRVGKYS